jgi:hypothetical protein
MADNPDIKEIIKSVNQDEKPDNTDNTNDSNLNIEHLKALEIAKIIVQETLKEKNIKSLSFLNGEQVDDIVKANLLNTYYQIPEIDKYIKDFLELKRSQDGQLIRLFTKMAMFNNESDEMNKKNLFQRILKR